MVKALALALLLAAPASALRVPPLDGRVVDQAGLLLSIDTHELTNKLKAYEDRTGRQIAVLTVPNLGGAILEEYSLKVAREWALGRSGVNDGVLILIARDERRMRIEVGHGLEAAIPDVLAGRIISEQFVPAFKSGAYARGINAGVDAVMEAADRGVYVPPKKGRADRAPFAGVVHALMFVPFLAAMLLFEAVAIWFPILGWVMYVFLFPFWFIVFNVFLGDAAAILALMSHALFFPILKLLYGAEGTIVRAFGVKGDGTWSDSGSSFDSGSSSSSDSFSGGGGSFGGGGASGSW